MKKLKIGIISNIVHEMYIHKIENYFKGLGKDLIISSIFFETLYTETISNRLKEPDILVLLLNFEFLYPNCPVNIVLNKNTETDYLQNTVNLYKRAIAYVKLHSSALMVIVGLENYYMQIYNVCGLVGNQGFIIDKINQEIVSLLNDRMVYIDSKQLIAHVGIEKTYNKKNKYRWEAPYSIQFYLYLINEVYKQYLIHNGITKKCLVLDCDNVLWGGILSEDGIEDISLGSYGKGKAFQAFQRFLVILYLHGVILAVSSKNDVEDVQKVFRTHKEMILKEEYIACFQVNWDEKVKNIMRISEFLNIDLKDIVFVDDSKFEIESINMLLPQVKTIQYNPDSIYRDLSCFNLSAVRNKIEIEKRNTTYKTNVLRVQLKKQYERYEDYLNALHMKITIKKALPEEFRRIAELTQRTNKCTNGMRFTYSDLKQRTDRFILYSIFISDKFADMGLAGAIAVKDELLLLFSLSCRVLGRNIENRMIEFIKKEHIIKKIFFKTTNKNTMLHELIVDKFKDIEIINSL